MTDSDSSKPGRRPRYSGKNPRQFHEKYKELRPELYTDEAAKVLARGRTPAGTHRPILVREIMEVLSPRPGETAVDCTLGYGGHSQELLAAVQPNGRLIAIDIDPIELPVTEARLRGLGFPEDSLVVRRTNYAGIAQVLAAEAPAGVDVILADLGLSSMQIDDPGRGFTFKSEGPLDMRMNPRQGKPASERLAEWGIVELASLLVENADETQPHEVAGAILRAQGRAPLTTTQSLAAAVRNAFRGRDLLPGAAADEAVRRAFQAIRIAVNDEFGSLDAFLRVLPSCLRPGGRIAILTFHSGEDRRVKLAFKRGFENGIYGAVSKTVVRAAADERRSNPRSTSAKLRFASRGPSSVNLVESS
ncbi:16S rRNA (cytosine(1402)-N(4))-methyltransferase RsmH [Isosphaeraceae bacterium EP7]